MKEYGKRSAVEILHPLIKTFARPNLHLHPQRGRKKSAEAGGSSAPGSPAKERLVEGAEPEKQVVCFALKDIEGVHDTGIKMGIIDL